VESLARGAPVRADQGGSADASAHAGGAGATREPGRHLRVSSGAGAAPLSPALVHLQASKEQRSTQLESNRTSSAISASCSSSVACRPPYTTDPGSWRESPLPIGPRPSSVVAAPCAPAEPAGRAMPSSGQQLASTPSHLAFGTRPRSAQRRSRCALVKTLRPERVACKRVKARTSGLLLSPEAVAYIGGSSKWSVSRRLICLGALPEGLRTAHFVSRSEAGRWRRTYATASPVCDRPRRRTRDACCGRRVQARAHVGLVPAPGREAGAKGRLSLESTALRLGPPRATGSCCQLWRRAT
jgi:hypothetical protein